MFIEQFSDAESHRHALYSLCEDAVSDNQGRLVQCASGVMALFSQAQDAVMAALVIKRAISKQRNGLPDQFGSMHYCIGIAGGEVKLDDGAVDPLVQKSMHIQARARRNQILIDDAVYDLIQSSVYDGTADFLIGAPKRTTLHGAGESTLYELSPGRMGLDVWQPAYESRFADFSDDWAS